MLALMTSTLVPFVRRPLGRRLMGPLAAVLLGAAWLPVVGDDHWQDLHDKVRSGQLVPMPVILDWLEERYEGVVLEVELEREKDRLIYEVEMLGPQGQLVEFEFDAASGELIGMEGVNIDGMRRTL